VDCTFDELKKVEYVPINVTKGFENFNRIFDVLITLYKLSPLLSFGKDSGYLMQKTAVSFFVRTKGKTEENIRKEKTLDLPLLKLSQF
jgi:hypothetical protein